MVSAAVAEAEYFYFLTAKCLKPLADQKYTTTTIWHLGMKKKVNAAILKIQIKKN